MRFMMLGGWDAANTSIPELLGEEMQRTSELTDAGLIEQLLLRADGAGGFMVVNADSVEDARAGLSVLPFVEHGRDEHGVRRADGLTVQRSLGALPPSPYLTAATRTISGSLGEYAYRRVGRSGSVPLVLCQRFRGTLDDWDRALIDVLVAEREVSRSTALVSAAAPGRSRRPWPA